MKQKKSYVITYADAEDASCDDETINASGFSELLKNQAKFQKLLLEKHNITVILVPFDKEDYQAFLKSRGLPDTRASRSEWAGIAHSKNKLGLQNDQNQN